MQILILLELCQTPPKLYFLPEDGTSNFTVVVKLYCIVLYCTVHYIIDLYIT